MNGYLYNVHKALKIIFPGTGVQALGWNQYDHSENLFNLRKFCSLLFLKFEKKV